LMGKYQVTAGGSFLVPGQAGVPITDSWRVAVDFGTLSGQGYNMVHDPMVNTAINPVAGQVGNWAATAIAPATAPATCPYMRASLQIRIVPFIGNPYWSTKATSVKKVL
jgi:hypothetical protein